MICTTIIMIFHQVIIIVSSLLRKVRKIISAFRMDSVRLIHQCPFLINFHGVLKYNMQKFIHTVFEISYPSKKGIFCIKTA